MRRRGGLCRACGGGSSSRCQRAAGLRPQAAHPPRLVPGHGAAGLPLLDEARRRTGLPVMAEPLEVGDIDVLRDHVDALMIGARSMHNTPLLRAAGQSSMTVIVKRGMSATYDEWLAAAEYVTGEGNTRSFSASAVFSTFETATRNTLDVSAIAVLREKTDLPIAVDPSHAAGNAELGPVAGCRRACGRRGCADHRMPSRPGTSRCATPRRRSLPRRLRASSRLRARCVR